MYDEAAMAGIWAFISTYMILIVAIVALNIIATWRIFVKAGRPGWASIIPFYSQYVLFEMVGLKGWYIFLAFIPCVGSLIIAVFSIISCINLAKCFGKGTGFGVGLIFLPFVFQLILAFDSSTYKKPVVANN